MKILRSKPYKIEKTNNFSGPEFELINTETKERLFGGTYNQCDDYYKFRQQTNSL